MTAEVQMNPATEWAWECWAEAMRKNPYVQQFVLNGGPFVVHAASCPEELATVEYEMAAAFVTAGRGQCLRKLGSNNALSQPDVSAALVFRLHLGTHEDPHFRAALESLTHRILLPFVRKALVY